MVLFSEGVYDNDPDDAGGETFYGLTRKYLDSIGIKTKPNKQQAINIYRQHIWDKYNLSDYHPVIAFSYGDAIINHGPYQATKMIQVPLSVKVDGIMGPVTHDSLKKTKNIKRFWENYRLFRIRFYVKISKNRNNKKFLVGWLVRVHTIAETLFFNGLIHAIRT